MSLLQTVCYCIDYFLFQVFCYLFLGHILMHFQWKHFFFSANCCLTGGLVSPASTPHPLPLVRVDQYFPSSLSLMWNWLFIQTLLPLHKDLDGWDGTKDERSTGHVPDTRLWTRYWTFTCLESAWDKYICLKKEWAERKKSSRRQEAQVQESSGNRSTSEEKKKRWVFLLLVGSEWVNVNSKLGEHFKFEVLMGRKEDPKIFTSVCRCALTSCFPCHTPCVRTHVHTAAEIPTAERDTSDKPCVFTLNWFHITSVLI